MLKPTPLQDSAIDRAATNAPSLLFAYAIYLVIAAITVSMGGRIPPQIVWLALAAVVASTSRSITPGWSLYNGLAAAFFFASFASKPFGDMHIHRASGWLAALGLLLVPAVVSLRRHGLNISEIFKRPSKAQGLPWMGSIPSIGDGSRSHFPRTKEDTWQT